MHNKTFIHRAATALLTVCLAATTAWAAYSGGTGTKDDPYLIANANDLNKLAHHLNYEATGYFDDKYFVQTADIDCNGYTYYDTWEPIGKDADQAAIIDETYQELEVELLQRIKGLETQIKKVNLHKRTVLVEFVFCGRLVTAPIGINIITNVINK